MKICCICKERIKEYDSVSHPVELNFEICHLDCFVREKPKDDLKEEEKRIIKSIKE
jgi:hypothetical protein